jgi:hypothetical protein
MYQPETTMNKCEICNTETKNRHYCSMKCRDVSRKKKSVAIVQCKTCGKDMDVVKKRPKKYCDKVCMANDIELRALKSKNTTEYRKNNKIDIEKIKNTNQKKYGVDWAFQSDVVKQKIKDTNIKKHGVEYPMQSERIKALQKTTTVNRYGGYGFESKETGDKIKNTILLKYGVSSPSKSQDVRDKTKQTNLLRYGVDTPLKNTDKMKAAVFEKYGVENISQTDANKVKIKNKLRVNYLNDIFHGDRLKNKVVPLFKESEYSINGDYHTKYPFECTACKTQFNDTLYAGNIPRCLKCFPIHVSLGETELLEYIKGIIPSEIVEGGNRTHIYPLELDINIPNKNLAIEYNGMYWHSEISGGKSRLYHLNKTNECKKCGIQLIHVFEQEWLEKQEIVKSIIATRLGIGKSIYARKLRVIEVDHKSKSEFLQRNHLQGDDRSGIRIGLIDDDGQILSLMTFCKSRYDKNFQYELSRFCNVLNARVVGGASKMFSYFIKRYNPVSVVSYSDKRWFTGGIYTSIGMTQKDDTPPSYSYTFNGKIVGNRVAFQKHKLVKKLANFNPDASEWENMKNNGFDRIWDCGNLKYIWTNPKL